jgi:hypothetical protein
MKGTVTGAVVVTVVASAYVGYLLTLDRILTPMRVTGLVLLATALGVTWGRVIWQLRQH